MKNSWHHYQLGLIGLAVFIAGCSDPKDLVPVTDQKSEREGPIRLTDVTQAAGIDFTHSHGGSGAHNYIETMGPGCAFVDYNQDGWLDVLLLQGAPLPDYQGARPLHPALYRNNRDGTFTEASGSLGLDQDVYGVGVAVGDYDNDGWPDLFVTALHGNHLLHNEKGERFLDVTKTAAVKGQDMSTSAVWLDYDLDGHLDLFVGRYMDYDLMTNPHCKDAQGRPAYCTPNVYTPTHSVLYRNQGDGTFSDVTERAGIGKASARAMGIACADFDNDGLIDIFVASDLSANLLFMNRGDGTFEERAGLSGVAYGDMGVARAGMGVDCADYDNDGNMDLVVTNFENEPNSLFHNMGKGMFQEQSMLTGVAKASHAALSWGCQFADFDQDGWPDLFWVSGHVNDYATEGKQSLGLNQPVQLLRNLDGNSFAEISKQSGEFFKRRQVARGAAFGDFDNDGDLDVLIGCNNQPALLVRNDSQRENNFVRLALTGQGCNRDALGARVRATAGVMTQCQFARSGTSYLSDHDRRLLFGIGKAAKADIEIQWPCGALQKLSVAANSTAAVVEAGCRRRHP